jgi:hypothetical protein
VTDDERTEEEEEEEEEGLFSFAFQNIYVLFVVTKSRAIFQRKTLYELAKNLKNSSFSQVTKQADGTESRHYQKRWINFNNTRTEDDEREKRAGKEDDPKLLLFGRRRRGRRKWEERRRRRRILLLCDEHETLPVFISRLFSFRPDGVLLEFDCGEFTESVWDDNFVVVRQREDFRKRRRRRGEQRCERGF